MDKLLQVVVRQPKNLSKLKSEKRYDWINSLRGYRDKKLSSSDIFHMITENTYWPHHKIITYDRLNKETKHEHNH